MVTRIHTALVFRNHLATVTATFSEGFNKKHDFKTYVKYSMLVTYQLWEMRDLLWTDTYNKLNTNFLKNRKSQNVWWLWIFEELQVDAFTRLLRLYMYQSNAPQWKASGHDPPRYPLSNV